MTKKITKQWVVYIIKTKSGKLYTGITNRLEQRFKAHQNNQKGARFFHFSSPDTIVFCEPQPDRSAASMRESAIKKMTRAEKLIMIESSYCRTLEFI